MKNELNSMFFILTALVFLSLFDANRIEAQVTVKLIPPMPNQLKADDLWKVEVINTSPSRLPLVINAELKEKTQGIIADAEISGIILSPGSKRFTYNDFNRAKLNIRNPKLQEAFSRRESALPGDYTICVIVKNNEGEEFARDCIEHTIEAPTQEMISPTLLLPENGAIFEMRQPVIFSWMLPSLKAGRDVTYKLKIGEIMGNQSAAQAMSSNPAFYEKDNIRATIFNYPASARKFEAGKSYACQITAVLDEVGVGESNLTLISFTTNTGCDCEDSYWKEVIVRFENYYNDSCLCDSTVAFPATVGRNIALEPNYACNPTSCTPSYLATVLDPSNSSANLTYPFSYTPSAPGNYTFTITPLCGNNKCQPCNIEVVVNDSIQTCGCTNGTWDLLQVESNGLPFEAYTCSDTVSSSIKPNESILIRTAYNCFPSTSQCAKRYTYKIYKGSTLVEGPVSSMQILPVINFTPHSTGIYLIEISTSCNNIECPSCSLFVKVVDVNVNDVPVIGTPPNSGIIIDTLSNTGSNTGGTLTPPGVTPPNVSITTGSDLESCRCTMSQNTISVQINGSMFNSSLASGSTLPPNTVKPNDIMSVKPLFCCDGLDCQMLINYIIKKNGAIIVEDSISFANITFQPIDTGNYEFLLIPRCGKSKCPICSIYFTVEIPPLTNPCLGIAVIIDSRNNVTKEYHTVEIGTQCWLKENLDVGTKIPGTQNSANNGIMEKYCYNDNTLNCNTYGALYQWDEAVQYNSNSQVKGLCPDGWHVPTKGEFNILKSAINADGNSLKRQDQGVGNGAGTNTSGFTALLGGGKNSVGEYYAMNSRTFFWSSTANNNEIGEAWYLKLDYAGPNIPLSATKKKIGFHIRCLKNSIPGATIIDIPTLIQPANGDVNQQTNITLVWNSASGASSYELQVSTDNGFTNLVFNQSGLTTTSQQVTNLNNSTVYYWRVRAFNSSGASDWSDVWMFTTIHGAFTPCPGIPTVYYSMKTYHTIKIGNQCWLRENLDYGNKISSNNNQTNNGAVEKYCYNNNVANCAQYGALYQWGEAMQYVSAEESRGICPQGWHIPSKQEFQTLLSEVNNNAIPLVREDQGQYCVGTNLSGFSALLGGYRYLDGTSHWLGNMTHFWTSTELTQTYLHAQSVQLFPNSQPIFNYWDKNFGYSIRCIKD